MKAVAFDELSRTGQQIYRRILHLGKDLRWFARQMDWSPDRQDKVHRFLRSGHDTPTLLRVAELLGCSAAELLPPEVFEPRYRSANDSKAIR